MPARRIRTALAAVALALAAGAAAAQAPGPVPGPGQGPAPATSEVEARAPAVLIVNRAAVVENSAAAAGLRETERRLRESVQAENDRVTSALAAEERELLRLRDELAADAFDERTRDFDRRVRAERRASQERGALLLGFLQDARAALASAVPRVLEGLRREKGAAAILDAAAVLAVDPALDVTEDAIARYDAEMGGVRFDPPAELRAD